MNKSAKVATAFAAGAAAGAALGVLFAPDKGSETRKKINQKSKKLTSGIKKNLRHGKEKLESLTKDVKQNIKEKFEEIK